MHIYKGIHATGVYVQILHTAPQRNTEKPLTQGNPILYCKFPKVEDLLLKQPSAIWAMKRTNRIILPESFQNKPSVQLRKTMGLFIPRSQGHPHSDPAMRAGNCNSDI